MGNAIVIEGPRCSGKTSVSEFIAYQYKFTRLKFTRPDDPASQMLEVIDMIKHSDDQFVIDRFHLTECIMRLYDFRRDSIEVVTSTKRLIPMVDDIALVAVLYADTATLSRRLSMTGRYLELPSNISHTSWMMAGLVKGVVLIDASVSVPDIAAQIYKAYQEKFSK